MFTSRFNDLPTQRIPGPDEPTVAINLNSLMRETESEPKVNVNHQQIREVAVTVAYIGFAFAAWFAAVAMGLFAWTFYDLMSRS